MSDEQQLQKFSLEFAHLCDYAALSNDGKMSVIGIFYQLNLQDDPPAFHPRFYYVARFLPNITATVNINVQVLSPYKKKLMDRDDSFHKQVIKGVPFGVYGNLDMLQIDKLGQHQLLIQVEDETFTRSFAVNKM